MADREVGVGWGKSGRTTHPAPRSTVENLGKVLPGSVLIWRDRRDGFGPDHATQEQFVATLIAQVGHTDFVVMWMPEGQTLEMLDEATMNEAGWYRQGRTIIREGVTIRELAAVPLALPAPETADQQAIVSPAIDVPSRGDG